MSIKDMPHVTVEQVLALREAAIKLEQELAEIKAKANEPAAKCHEGQCKHQTYKLHLRGVRKDNKYLMGIIHSLQEENEQYRPIKSERDSFVEKYDAGCRFVEDE